VRRLLGGDGGDAVVIFVVEAAQHVEDLDQSETGWPRSPRASASSFSLAV
jgi:hypothetical protein